MRFSITPSPNTLQDLYKRTRKATERGQLILRQFPFVGPILAGNPLRSGNTTHFLIVCLSESSGKFKRLHGPKADLILILTLIGYCHDVDSRDVTLIHDFDATYTDANNVRRNMPRTPSSKVHIKSAIRRIMKLVGPHSKVFFYFGGHGVGVRPATVRARGSAGFEVSTADDETCGQGIIAGDGKIILGEKLRSWLSSTKYPSVAITTVFDACCSGELLGLRYTYEPAERGIRLRDNLDHDVHLLMLQISACGAKESAFSSPKGVGGVVYGELTWTLARYLEETKNPSIEGLVYYLHANRPPHGGQMPRVCCSRPLTGQIALF